MSTMDGNNDDNRRTSPRFKKLDDSENNDGNSPTKRKSDEHELGIDGKGAKGTEGADAPAEKKKKVEGSEDDDAENPSHATAAFLVNEETNANSNGQVREISGDMNDVHNEQVRVYQMDANAQDEEAAEKVEDDAEKKKYISKLSKRQKKATVMIDGVKEKAYELDNAEVKKVVARHNDLKDPFTLTKDAAMVISTSREFYEDVNGGKGKRLAENPMKLANNTDVEGATNIERVVSNLSEYLVNPGNASLGSDKAGFKDLRKQHAANGKGVADHTGVKATQETLGGSPFTKILESEHTKVKGHKVNGEDFTEVTVKSSSEAGIKASKNQNRTCLVLAEAGVTIKNTLKASGSKEVKKMKNSTTTLKSKLTDHIGMAQHPRNRKGNKSYPDDKHPWYNMKMTFFFKGREEDVAQYQQTVDTPSEDEVAMLVKKMDLAKKK